jgi:hypothetical protein
VEGSIRKHAAALFLSCVCGIGGASCALLTGLDDLKEVACVQDCGQGGPPSDASDDLHASDALSDALSDGGTGPDASETAVDEAGDVSQPVADGSDEASGSTPDADAGALDTGMGGDSSADAPASESGPVDSGPDGAEAAPQKCGSVLLTATTATASSVRANPPATLMVDGPAPLAIDGTFATRWESEWMRDPSWIDLDFGAQVYVSEVDILWQAACAVSYAIEVSNDEVNWVNVKNGVITGNHAGIATPPNQGDWSVAVKHTNLSGAGRYLRINGTARCEAAFGYSIWEMRVFGDPDGDCIP